MVHNKFLKLIINFFKRWWIMAMGGWDSLLSSPSIFSWITILHSRVLTITQSKTCSDTIIKLKNSICCQTSPVFQWISSREVHNWPKSLNSCKSRKVSQRYTWLPTHSAVSMLELPFLSLELIPKWEVWQLSVVLTREWDLLITVSRNPTSVRSVWQTRHSKLSVLHRRMLRSSHRKTLLTSIMWLRI